MEASLETPGAREIQTWRFDNASQTVGCVASFFFFITLQPGVE